MGKYTANLNITTSKGESSSATISGDYEEVFSIKQKVDSLNAFTTVFTSGTTKGMATF